MFVVSVMLGFKTNARLSLTGSLVSFVYAKVQVAAASSAAIV